MHLNKRGVALLQVLIIAAVLAGLSAMILRVVLSRTLVARQNRRTVSAQMLIERCMAKINDDWERQPLEEYANALEGAIHNGELICCINGRVSVSGKNLCRKSSETNRPDAAQCTFTNPFGDGVDHIVNVYSLPKEDGQCVFKWAIHNGVEKL